jgi:hypothetical protein
VERPHPVAVKVEVEEQVEFAGRVLVSPDHRRRLLELLCCRPQHARYLRLVQPGQPPRLMRWGVGCRGLSGRRRGRSRRGEGKSRAGGWHSRCRLSPCQNLTTGVRHWDVDLWGRLRLACRPSGGWRRHRRLRLSSRDLPQ